MPHNRGIQGHPQETFTQGYASETCRSRSDDRTRSRMCGHGNRGNTEARKSEGYSGICLQHPLAARPHRRLPPQDEQQQQDVLRREHILSLPSLRPGEPHLQGRIGRRPYSNDPFASGTQEIQRL